MPSAWPGQVTVKASSSLWAILNNKILKPLAARGSQVEVQGKLHRFYKLKKELTGSRFSHMFAVVTFTDLYILQFFIIHMNLLQKSTTERVTG